MTRMSVVEAKDEEKKVAKNEIAMNHLPVWGHFNEPYPNTNLCSIVEEGLAMVKSQASSVLTEVNSSLSEETFEETSY